MRWRQGNLSSYDINAEMNKRRNEYIRSLMDINDTARTLKRLKTTMLNQEDSAQLSEAVFGRLLVDSVEGGIDVAIGFWVAQLIENLQEVTDLRFAWRGFPQCTLYNGKPGPDSHAGVAAAPFRLSLGSGCASHNVSQCVHTGSNMNHFLGGRPPPHCSSPHSYPPCWCVIMLHGSHT